MKLTMMEAMTIKTMAEAKLKREVRWYLDAQESDKRVLETIAMQNIFELEKIVEKMNRIIDPPAIRNIRRAK